MGGFREDGAMKNEENDCVSVEHRSEQEGFGRVVVPGNRQGWMGEVRRMACQHVEKRTELYILESWIMRKYDLGSAYPFMT